MILRNTVLAKNRRKNRSISYKNGTYTGELKNGLPHGRGVYSSGGLIHEGEWSKGWLGDYGIIPESDGRVYDGCWRVGKSQQSRLQFHPPSGTIYEGSWKNGLKHGKGFLQLQDGSQKIGIWENDRFNKEITEEELFQSAVPYRNGLFLGDMENGVPHGIGRFTCEDYSYEGEWECGLRHGKGTNVTAKSVYCGSWEHDKRNGYGVESGGCLEYSSRYEGAWKNDLMHGHGILIISNGTTYEGGWKDGKRWGHGTEVSRGYGIDSKYVGEWKNNQKNGLGKEVTLMHGMKAEYKGGWKNNRKYGFGNEIISGGNENDGDCFKIHSCKVNLANSSL